MELCLMIDHVHILLLSDSLEVISAFIRHYIPCLSRNIMLVWDVMDHCFIKVSEVHLRKGARR